MAKKQIENDLIPFTVADLMNELVNQLKIGSISKDTPVILSSDEEGNSFSPLVFRGLSIDDSDGTKRLYFYPLYQYQPDEL